MSTNLDPQAREALLRALPYIHPERRGILAAVLMGEMFDEDNWVVADDYTTDFNLDWCVYHMIRCSPEDMRYINRVNKAIDDLEAQSK